MYDGKLVREKLRHKHQVKQALSAPVQEIAVVESTVSLRSVGRKTVSLSRLRLRPVVEYAGIPDNYVRTGHDLCLGVTYQVPDRPVSRWELLRR